MQGFVVVAVCAALHLRYYDTVRLECICIDRKYIELIILKFRQRRHAQQNRLPLKFLSHIYNFLNKPRTNVRFYQNNRVPLQEDISCSRPWSWSTVCCTF